MEGGIWEGIVRIHLHSWVWRTLDSETFPKQKNNPDVGRMATSTGCVYVSNKNRHARGQSRVEYGLKLSWREVVFRSVLPVETNMQKGMAVSLVAQITLESVNYWATIRYMYAKNKKSGGASGSFPPSKYILI